MRLDPCLLHPSAMLLILDVCADIGTFVVAIPLLRLIAFYCGARSDVVRSGGNLLTNPAMIVTEYSRALNFDS